MSPLAPPRLSRAALRHRAAEGALDDLLDDLTRFGSLTHPRLQRRTAVRLLRWIAAELEMERPHRIADLQALTETEIENVLNCDRLRWHHDTLLAGTAAAAVTQAGERERPARARSLMLTIVRCGEEQRTLDDVHGVLTPEPLARAWRFTIYELQVLLDDDELIPIAVTVREGRHRTEEAIAQICRTAFAALSPSAPASEERLPVVCCQHLGAEHALAALTALDAEVAVPVPGSLPVRLRFENRQLQPRRPRVDQQLLRAGGEPGLAIAEQGNGQRHLDVYFVGPEMTCWRVRPIVPHRSGGVHAAAVRARAQRLMQDSVDRGLPLPPSMALEALLLRPPRKDAAKALERHIALLDLAQIFAHHELQAPPAPGRGLL